jgi:regulator of cell morphogenesis and NO signaling
MIDSASTLRSIALEQPATIRVFERFHLDYCCGGKRPLGEACAEKGLAAEEVLAALADAASTTPDEEDFSQATPTELIHHIVQIHHAYIRSELPHLQSMAERVATRHGPVHPEVTVVQRNLAQLADELIFHLDKEERILFPYIEGLARSRNQNAAPPSACFGSVESPIRAMIHEHEGAAALLAEIRAVTHGFVPWLEACPTTVGLYHGLDAFERDLHRHVHLENNLLFPRAIALKSEVLVVQ